MLFLNAVNFKNVHLDNTVSATYSCASIKMDEFISFKGKISAIKNPSEEELEENVKLKSSADPVKLYNSSGDIFKNKFKTSSSIDLENCSLADLILYCRCNVDSNVMNNAKASQFTQKHVSDYVTSYRFADEQKAISKQRSNFCRINGLNVGLLQERHISFKEVKVPCLQDLESLESISAKQNLRMCLNVQDTKNLRMCLNKAQDTSSDSESDNQESPDEYEVEDIVDYSYDMDTHWYLVKWKNWESEFNTWEPRENLTGCKDLIKAFHWKPKKYTRKRKFSGGIYSSHKNSKKNELGSFIMRMCKPDSEDVATLLKLIGISLKEFNSHGNICVLKRKLKDMVSHSDTESKKYTNGILKKLQIEDKFGSEDELLDFARKRRKLLKSLKNWQCEMNNLSTEAITITVENHVDLEGPPKDFIYITDYKPGEGIIIPDDPLIGCDCNSCYDGRKTCCATQSGGRFAYNKQGILNVPKGTPIYECNRRCKCDESCPNRVVQQGRKINLAIFRTDDGRGWGVKTLRRIKTGSFVMEYFGEVITNEEAERRGRVYDAQGQTYLFDLDFNDGECLYSVDAAHYGNIAHFMNHSCDPNLEVYAVWINNLDPSLPRIAFFAKREIKRGEELTFDYQMSASGETFQASKVSLSPLKTSIEQTAGDIRSTSNFTNSEPQIKRIHCKCGTLQCRKYLF